MSTDEKSKARMVLIVRAHVESKTGGKLRVVRLEPSKAGTRLLTSTSSSINGEKLAPSGVWAPRKKIREAA
jgi:hypothetical protein